MDTLPPLSALPSGGRLTVDLSALVGNWRTIRSRVGAAEAAAVVKGDAYGIGLEPAARALHAAGCRTFFVALPRGGVRLRAVLPDAVIYVLNGFFDGAGPVYTAARLRPVLGSRAEVDAWLAETGGSGEPAAIHVDTGMNRLGLTRDEAVAVAADAGLLARLRPALVMSHLACADAPGHPLTAEQIRRFTEVRALFPGVPGSLSNSAGVDLGPEVHHDLVRPGIALYGARWAADRPPLEPVATLEGRLIQVNEVPAGAAVGYGAAFRAERPSRIGIVSVGYADGYLRRAGASDAGPGASAAIGGMRVPLAGRVSMDMLAVDLTDAPAELCRRGGWVELFGRTVPVDEVAGHAGTIGWELLTGIGDRYERRYVGG
ncbi:alanine racemase [Chthonobacter rhizosphaerae]|uniref:alanine racemase n=1 Tax=Chthonobacter rhizosphaerae TaxID=2735553 RepID=UPI0015EF9830|nr:alanine racemase [Chthonobacter rhizosphaerae]